MLTALICQHAGGLHPLGQCCKGKALLDDDQSLKTPKYPINRQS